MKLTWYFACAWKQNGSEHASHSVGDGCVVEVVLVEARDLVAADWGGTSDPYVSVRYGNTKKRTKVLFSSLCIYPGEKDFSRPCMFSFQVCASFNQSRFI